MPVTTAILDSMHAAGYTVTTRRVQTRDGVWYRGDAREKDGELGAVAGEDEYAAVVELEPDVEE